MISVACRSSQQVNSLRCLWSSYRRKAMWRCLIRSCASNAVGVTQIWHGGPSRSACPICFFHWLCGFLVHVEEASQRELGQLELKVPSRLVDDATTCYWRHFASPTIRRQRCVRVESELAATCCGHGDLRLLLALTPLRLEAQVGRWVAFTFALRATTSRRLVPHV